MEVRMKNELPRAHNQDHRLFSLPEYSIWRLKLRLSRFAANHPPSEEHKQIDALFYQRAFRQRLNRGSSASWSFCAIIGSYSIFQGCEIVRHKTLLSTHAFWYGLSRQSRSLLFARSVQIRFPVTSRVAQKGRLAPNAPSSFHPSCTSGFALVMAQKTYAWISLWFLITAPLMIWDAGYCLMRPRSMVGGDLHWFWKPYDLYGKLDYVYGVKAFEDGDGFASAAALLNLLETSANIAYLVGTHVYETRTAPLMGYTGASMTLAKTILYGAQEYFCNGCAVGHNSPLNLFAFWIFPNILWMVFPGLIMWRLGGDMMAAIDNGGQKSKTN